MPCLDGLASHVVAFFLTKFIKITTMPPHIREAMILTVELFQLHTSVNLDEMDDFTGFRYVSRLARTLPINNAEDYATIESWIELDHKLEYELQIQNSIIPIIEKVETSLEKSSTGWLEDMEDPSAADFCWKMRLKYLEQLNYMNFNRYVNIMDYLIKEL